METTKVDYVMKKVTIDKDNIGEFEFMTNRRNLRMSRVRKIKTALKRGDCFSPISVNIRNGKKYVLDGNHRITAVEEFIQETGAGIEIWEQQFHIPDKEGEIERFVIINDSCKTSSDDMINLYQEDQFVKNLLTIPCVSIYGSPTKPIKIRSLMSAYFMATPPKNTRSFLSSIEMVRKIQAADREDLKNIKAFLKDYELVFGDLRTKSNMWLSTTLITAMFRIWYQNKGIPFENAVNRLRTLINHPEAIAFSRQGGVEASHLCAERFVEILNNKRGPKFVLETDVEEEPITIEA